MSPKVRVVEYFLERGDLSGCESSHVCVIDIDPQELGMLIEIKSSTAHTRHGDQNITGELTMIVEKEIKQIAMDKHLLALAQPTYDWDPVPTDAA